MATLQVKTGSCGWGIIGGLIPELRLGRVQFTYADADFAAILQRLRNALAECSTELRCTIKTLEDMVERNADLTDLAERQGEKIVQLELELTEARAEVGGVNISDEISEVQFRIQQAADGVRALSEKELDEISEKMKRWADAIENINADGEYD